MRRKGFFVLLTTCLVLACTQMALAQDDQTEDAATREVFFATRPVATKSTANNSSGTASSARKTTGGGRAGASRPDRPADRKNTPTTGAGGTGKSGGSASSGGVVTPGPATPAIGLGYTIFMRDASGGAVRADTSKTFAEGDQIRLVVEPNTDGYIYIFHTEDGRNPQMLFPDVRLGRGDNAVRAHVLYQVPSDPRDWFRFDANPATERLYIVVSRRPLPDVPNGDALLKYVQAQMTGRPTADDVAAHCRNSPATCIWKPTEAAWSRILTASKGRVAVSKSSDSGRSETNVERESRERGIGLSRAEPAPSIIRISGDANSPMLVTTVDLIHN